MGLRKNLKMGGKIIFYAYSLITYPHKSNRDVPPASRKSFISRLENETDFVVESKTVTGIRDKAMDKIIILKKK